MANRVPITRLGKFFGDNDFNLEIEMGQEWLIGDMNYTCVLYRVDKPKLKLTTYTVKRLRTELNSYPPLSSMRMLVLRHLRINF